MRPAAAGDRAAVLTLLAASLGWPTDEGLDQQFAWKHEQNPFGPSPSWVALDGGRVVGFRTFLRWELTDAQHPLVRAVRAVDTATLPSHQGRGIFRLLTERAVLDLAATGVDLVFNTPNAQSRPGYLKMGWTQLGHLPVSARMRSPSAPLRMLTARVPAERGSLATGAGLPATEVLADEQVRELLAAVPPTGRLETRRSAEHLAWRYGFAPLGYRCVTLSSDVREGLAVFRRRRRGSATECVLCELLVPEASPSARRALVRAVVRSSGSDYVIRLGGPSLGRVGFVPLPGQGPILTWRPLADAPPGGALTDWDLTLGDVELF